jgi:hypothetical protein
LLYIFFPLTQGSPHHYFLTQHRLLLQARERNKGLFAAAKIYNKKYNSEPTEEKQEEKE